MPPAAAAASNIRASLRWREPSVYAGEEIECVITFRNIAEPAERVREREGAHARPVNGDARHAGVAPSAAAHSRRSSLAQVKAQQTPSRPPSISAAPPKRGHKPALSLNVISGVAGQHAGGLQSAPMPLKTPNSAVKGHGRSLSIMSYGSEAPSDGRAPTAGQGLAAKRGGKGGHARSASLQYIPRPMPSCSPNPGIVSPRNPSPLYESVTPFETPGQPHALPRRPARRRPGVASAGNTPQLGRSNSLHTRNSSGTFAQDFQFPRPQQQPQIKEPPSQPDRRLSRSPSMMHSAQTQRGHSPRPPPEGWSGGPNNLNPITRVMSESSTTGTPRSSSEFYSMSNHSDETLTSEIPSHAANGRLLHASSHSRQASRSPPAVPLRPPQPETLMMATVQTGGSFTLDGSLVNAAPFEEVKRRGAQTGGGVVGVERGASGKRSSGMFGAFSWNNIGESLGGLLGADESKSSMAQMKANVGGKSVPLLRTPQSLLFVDLRLAPGESKSFTYRFQLPRGLPPSHRGRAMKVAYHLTVSIQRPEKQQAMRHVEFPFRVLGSYNGRGETLGHDLMSPYILLHDTAKSASVPSSASSSPFTFPAKKDAKATSKTPKQGLEDFLRYTERLLDEPSEAHGALASPTSPTSTRKQSLAEPAPASTKEAVDFAILRANYIDAAPTSAHNSANRFNIARAGHPVAVLTLLRPAFRLGEPVIGTLDFGSDACCAALVELESAERVDASLALRSAGSVQRVTRRVHAHARANALFARRAAFALPVPAAATPGFETTGVGVVWRVRVEFTVQRQGVNGGSEPSLLEELSADERGTTLIARERLPAETFEVGVPIRVLGVPVGVGGEGGTAVDGPWGVQV